MQKLYVKRREDDMGKAICNRCDGTGVRDQGTTNFNVCHVCGGTGKKVLMTDGGAVEDKVDGLAVDTFSTELGCTVRSCLSCGVLIAGGATRCGFCAYRYSAREYGWWDPLWKFMKRLSKAVKFFRR